MLTAVAVAASDLVAPGDVWRAWSFDPAEVLLLVATAAIYARAVITARRQSRGRAVRPSTIILFALGWLALVLALLSPIDRLGETIFAGHMAQHLILIVVAAPLVVAGAPPAVWLWALPRRGRRAAAHLWSRVPAARSAAQWLTNPPIVLVAHIAALWFWHFPRPYQAALEHAPLHLLEHASFFGTAVLFWWVTLHPAGRRRLGYGSAMLYVGVTLCQSGALGALLMFSAAPWYTAHAAGERLWGLTPLADQQLAGLIMWIPAGVVYIAAAAWLFLRWMSADERAAFLADHPAHPTIVGDAT